MAQAETKGLWQADAGRPPWFKPEVFLANNFDAEAVIRDMRRFVSPVVDQPVIIHCDAGS